MKSFTYVITDPVGLHVRVAGLIVKEVKKYSDTVCVIKGGKSVKAKSPMALMTLAAKHGDEVTVEVTGENEEVTAAALEAFFKANC